MSSNKTVEFRNWLFKNVVTLEDAEKRKAFAELIAPFFAAVPVESPIALATTADEIEDGADEFIGSPTIPVLSTSIDESTRHPHTGSAAPRPALKPTPPGLRPPRADATLAVLAQGWNGSLGVMAKAVYGKNNPHNRRKARSMLHSLRTRGKAALSTDGQWTVIAKPKSTKNGAHKAS